MTHHNITFLFYSWSVQNIFNPQRYGFRKNTLLVRSLFALLLNLCPPPLYQSALHPSHLSVCSCPTALSLTGATLPYRCLAEVPFEERVHLCMCVGVCLLDKCNVSQVCQIPSCWLLAELCLRVSVGHQQPRIELCVHPTTVLVILTVQCPQKLVLLVNKLLSLFSQCEDFVLLFRFTV